MGSDGLKVSQPAKGLAASSCSPGRGAGGSGGPGSEPGSDPGSGLLHVESTGSSVKAASKFAVSAASLRSGVKSGV